MITRLHHIHLLCSDIDKAALFFRDVFDAEESYRGLLGGRPFMRMGLAGLVISITGIDPVKGQLDPGSGKCGLDHFCLQVDSMEKTVARMQEKGVPILQGPVVSDTGNTYIFVEGPDGIQIELLELKK